jgi:hypothetical protein
VVRLAVAATLTAALSCGSPAPEDRFRFSTGTSRDDFMNPPAVDPLKGMDTGDTTIALTASEIRGRNTWMIWTAGNEEFWDWMARYGHGTVDFLKLIDSRKRPVRFKNMGLINDPNLRAATKPDSFGIYLDEIVTSEPKEIKADVYGRPSGVMGLRVYPNPMFDSTARRKWMARVADTAFYKDPKYFNDKNLIRPYIVGMSCGFCHVSHHPLYPPKDPENPQFTNMSATIGAQYFRTAPIFAPGMEETNFIYQLLLGYREGTTDTSLIPSDQIFNPSNMNSIFELGARMKLKWKHTMGPANLDVPAVTQTMEIPQVLKDGADNVGVIGALSRVFINIGEYWELWTTLHTPLLGLKKQEAFSVKTAKAHSDYWNATAARLDDMAAYFLKVGSPMQLKDAPGGAAYMTKDTAVLATGRRVFADECAECHSSKQPEGVERGSDAAKTWYRTSVNAADFRTDNWLGTDERFPAPTVGVNACRSAGTNAGRGHVWDNFSSETYKSATAVRPFKVLNLYGADSNTITLPAGGPGYIRPASLVSMWATAPFLHNNSLGIVTHDPSTAGRMKAFDDAIAKLLSPQSKRPDTASISRTMRETSLDVPMSDFSGLIGAALKSLAGDDTATYLRIGPIPKGTPVGLIGSISAQLPLSLDELKKLGQVFQEFNAAVEDAKKNNLQGAALRERMRVVAPKLIAASNCIDFVEDRGHYYGVDLTEKEKKALIEFLKTL